MNPARVLFVLVVVAIVLVVAIARVRTPSSHETGGNTEPFVTFQMQAVESADANPAKALPENVDASAPTFSWRNIESADYREYVRNLRAIGCPEKTLRDIVIADVTKMFAPREQPLKAMLTNNESYSSTVQMYEQRKKELEIRKRLRAVQLEKNALLHELVGVQLPVDVLRSVNTRSYAHFEAAFNALPTGPREVVRDIQEKYWQNSDALSEKYRGTNANSNWRTPEYLAEYTKLNQERRAALANAMTPTQMEDYDIRTTDEGIALRSQLAGIAVSEEEFRTMFRSRREAENPYGGGNLTAGLVEYDAAGNPTRATDERRAKIEEQIKSTLGEDRYAQLRKASDSTYQTFTRLGERYGLTSDAVEQAYLIQQQMKADRATAMTSGTAQERSARLRKLGEEFETKMNQVLGERASKMLRTTYGDFGVIR